MAVAWIIPPLSMTSITASATALGDDGNLALDYAGLMWNSGSVASVSLTIDLGGNMPLDTIALFGVASAPANATMQISLATSAQGPFTGAFWSDSAAPLYAGTVMPASKQGVALWSAPSVSPPPASARYVQITITAPSNFTLQLARIVIGKRIQLSRNFSYGAEFGVRDLGSIDFSARGVLLRRRGVKLRTVSLTFSNIRKDELELQTKPLLERIGNTEMIAVITDPAPDTQRQNRAYFGALVGDLGHVWPKASGFEAKTNVVSIF